MGAQRKSTVEGMLTLMILVNCLTRTTENSKERYSKDSIEFQGRRDIGSLGMFTLCLGLIRYISDCIQFPHHLLRGPNQSHDDIGHILAKFSLLPNLNRTEGYILDSMKQKRNTVTIPCSRNRDLNRTFARKLLSMRMLADFMSRWMYVGFVCSCMYSNPRAASSEI